MDTPAKGVSYYIKRLFSSKKSIGIVAVIVLVLAVPFTVYLAQRSEDIRQRANELASQPTPTASVTYPWQYPRTANNPLPIVSTAMRSLIATIPFSARNCSKKSLGDADCNNQIDLSDVSYWQIDYEKGTAYYADFNGDGKVTLTDYNIWRQHANIAAIPVVQKLSEKLGIEKFLAATLWKIASPNNFRAFAADALPTVSNSTVQTAADVYRILNQYTDQSYSVQTNETGNTGGQMTYYDPNGNQTAQVNNYAENTSTTTTQIGGNNVTITQNPDGAMQQTIQNANGSFRAAQLWPSAAAYARGDFPQAVTLPIGSGYTTVSLSPNNGTQVTSRDGNGYITSYTAMIGARISINDYISNSYTVSNGDNNRTAYRLWNNLGGQTIYLFENLSVVSTIVTDNKQNINIITSSQGGQYRISTTNSKNEITEQTVSDPMGTLGVNSPNPSSMTQSTQQYVRTRNTSSTSFTTGFATNGRMPTQIVAVNRLLAVQNTQPVVLGAKVTRIDGKAVLGEHSVLLAQDTGGEGGSSRPARGADQDSMTTFADLANAGTNWVSGLLPTPYTGVDLTPGQVANYVNPDPEAPGNRPAQQTPPDAAPAVQGRPAADAAPPGGYPDPNAYSTRQFGPGQDLSNPDGLGVPSTDYGIPPPVNRSVSDADTGADGGVRSDGVDSRPAPAGPAEPHQVPPTNAAAAQVAAEVSEAVTTVTVTPEGTIANSFTTNGSVSTYSNGASVDSSAAEGLSGVSLQGSISVEADHGVATSITVDGNTFSLNTETGQFEYSGSAPGASPVNSNTIEAVNAQIDIQAAVTGAEQGAGISIGTGGDIAAAAGYDPGQSPTEQGVPAPAEDTGATSSGPSVADLAAAGIDAQNPGDAQVGNSPSADPAPAVAEAPSPDAGGGGGGQQPDGGNDTGSFSV